MTKEPEDLTALELLRIENIQLQRRVLQLQEEILTGDIGRARCLDKSDYGKTWMVQEGRILTVPAQEEVEADAQP